MDHIFDTHAHYWDAKFGAEDGADGILKRIMPEPVERVINIGTNPETSRFAVEQAAKYDGMYAAVGIHPEDCHALSDMEESIAKIRAMAANREIRRKNKVVAIGEIGLDYHYANYGEIPLDKEKEAAYFDAQMSLAEELGLPVVIHDREAHGDCMEMIMKYPKVHGVFHSYSGSAEMAKDLVRRGWYLSFSGTLTFKNARNVREAAQAIPRERLLVETDCPYLAPEPVRGTLNHSGNLPYILGTVAELWGVTPIEAADVTFENAKRLFLSEFV